MKSVALNYEINTYQTYDNDIDAFLGSIFSEFFELLIFSTCEW